MTASIGEPEVVTNAVKKPRADDSVTATSAQSTHRATSEGGTVEETGGSANIQSCEEVANDSFHEEGDEWDGETISDNGITLPQGCFYMDPNTRLPESPQQRRDLLAQVVRWQGDYLDYSHDPESPRRSNATEVSALPEGWSNRSRIQGTVRPGAGPFPAKSSDLPFFTWTKATGRGKSGVQASHSDTPILAAALAAMVEDGEMDMNGIHSLYHWSSDFHGGHPAQPWKEGEPSRRVRCGWQRVSPLTAASKFRGHLAFGHQVSYAPNAETFEWCIYDPSVDGGPARICATFNSTRVVIDHLSFTEATVADVIAEFQAVSSIAAERFRAPTWEGGAYKDIGDKICEGGYFYMTNDRPAVLQFAVQRVGFKSSRPN